MHPRRGRTGCTAGEAILDDDGHGITDIPIRATVTKKGDALTVDLTDSHAAGASASSTPRSPTRCRPCTWRSPTSSIRARPKNDGTFRPVKVIARAGHDRVAVPAGAGDARHQPLRAGDRGGDHQGAREALPGPRPRGLGAALPHRHQGRESAHASASSSGTSSTRAAAAAPRPRATAGRPRARGRRRAASSSAAIEVAEARFPLFFERHEFRPDSFGDGQLSRRRGLRADAADGDHRARAWPTPPATACAIPRTASSAARTACPHRYRLLVARQAARAQDQGGRHSRSCRATCSSSSRRAAAATGPPARALGERPRRRRRERLRDRQAHGAPGARRSARVKA